MTRGETGVGGLSGAGVEKEDTVEDGVSVVANVVAGAASMRDMEVAEAVSTGITAAGIAGEVNGRGGRGAAAAGDVMTAAADIGRPEGGGGAAEETLEVEEAGKAEGNTEEKAGEAVMGDIGHVIDEDEAGSEKTVGASNRGN